MPSLTSDGIGWLSLICLMGGTKIATSLFSWTSKKKRDAALRAEVAGIRGKDQHELTIAEVIALQAELHERLTPRGMDAAEARSAIWASTLIEYDLGQYADKPMPRNLDAAQRDILVVHARRDAAEALANSKVLLREVERLTKASSEFTSMVFWAGLIFAVFQLFKVGFAS